MAEMTYASSGKGNLGVTLGAIGTGLSILGSNGGLNLFGGVGGNSQYATKESVEAAIALSEKNSEIAMLRSEANENTKIIDTYKEVMARINADKMEQQAINAQQAVYNSTANANIGILNNQVAQLVSLTKIVVPADNVCPKPMPQYNSWTAPTNPTT